MGGALGKRGAGAAVDVMLGCKIPHTATGQTPGSCGCSLTTIDPLKKPGKNHRFHRYEFMHPLWPYGSYGSHYIPQRSPYFFGLSKSSPEGCSFHVHRNLLLW